MKTLIRTLVTLPALMAVMTARAQVPFLSSHPSAQAVIYLDFDGHTVTGTSWNYNGPIVCGASGLNNSQVTEVFNRVSQDYRPFNINITTDSTKFLEAPVNRRMRVILTVTSSWYGAAGGVAFVGSFSWGDDNPCFVFSQLLNFNVKNISEAASHEAGHTLGLYHQSAYDSTCAKISDYNPGVGTGEIGWAPIMGVGYYRNLTVWSNGPNSYGCTNYQNDLDIITSATNGFGYRADDHGNTIAGASPESFASGQFTADGVIEQNTDADIFRFVIPSFGRFTLDAIPDNVGTGNVGSNLDIQVTLYNTAETVLNVYNPGTLLSSVIDTNLNAGAYYLKVEGKGNQYAPNYAILGSYSLGGTFTGGTVLALRKLELKARPNGENHDLEWTIDADELVKRQVIEISKDGTQFEPLGEVYSGSREYSYRPSQPLSAQYRLNVVFSNGQQYYSNIVAIRQRAEPAPQLVGSMIHGNTIVVSSPGRYHYALVDVNGKILTKGQLNTGVNNITAGQIPAGLYIIRFCDSSRQWTEKLVRR